MDRIRRIAAAGAAAMAAFAAAGAAGIAPASAQGLAGSYLAGKHAANVSDVEQAARYFGEALARDPENLSLMEQALIYQTAAGRAESAIPLAEKIVAGAPDHRLSHLLLVAADFRAGDYAAAAKRVEDAPSAHHPLVAGMLGAWAAYASGGSAAGEAKFATLGDSPIFRVFSRYHTGLMRHAEGDAAAAVEAFEDAADEMNAPTGRFARAYAGALRVSGDEDKARTIYQGALGIAVGDPVFAAELNGMDSGETPKLLVTTPEEGAAEALYGLAAALGREGDERLSLFYARVALFLRPDFDDASLLAAELLESQSQFALAIEAYEAISADSPMSRSAEIGRADALRQMGQQDQAIEALRALTRRELGAVDAHIALGDLLRRAERFGEAAKAYDAAIKLMEAADRPNWVLYYERGISYERSDQWEKAEADFFRALELQPDQPLVLNYLGYSWLEMGMNLDRALDMIEKAVEQRPQDGYIVDSLGWAHYLMENFPEAVTELERAVELRPIDPVINDHLGDALWRVGRRLEAEFQWKRALSFEPEDEDRDRIVRKLDVGLDVVLADEEREDAEPSGDATANDG